jgi:hypothetical protein
MAVRQKVLALGYVEKRVGSKRGVQGLRVVGQQAELPHLRPIKGGKNAGEDA